MRDEPEERTVNEAVSHNCNFMKHVSKNYYLKKCAGEGENKTSNKYEDICGLCVQV